MSKEHRTFGGQMELLPVGTFDATAEKIEQILDHGLSVPYEVNPLSTGNVKEHENFAKYLKDSILSIDVWNGEDET